MVVDRIDRGAGPQKLASSDERHDTHALASAHVWPICTGSNPILRNVQLIQVQLRLDVGLLKQEYLWAGLCVCQDILQLVCTVGGGCDPPRIMDCDGDRARLGRSLTSGAGLAPSSLSAVLA
jgi:hypothetical protein